MQKFSMIQCFVTTKTWLDLAVCPTIDLLEISLLSPDEVITWSVATFTERQIHLGDENFRSEDSDTLFPLRDVAIVAGREPHAEQVDAVAGEDEDEDDE